MPRTIVKVAPDRDLYMEWSSIVDAPTFIGTRAQIAQDQRSEGETHGNPVDARLARADETGTSAHDQRHEAWNDGRYPPEGHWEDSGFIWDQRGWLPRTRLPEAIDWILANDHGTDLPASMLDPFEDMTDEDREQYRNGCDDRGVVWADWEVAGGDSR